MPSRKSSSSSKSTSNSFLKDEEPSTVIQKKRRVKGSILSMSKLQDCLDTLQPATSVSSQVLLKLSNRTSVQTFQTLESIDSFLISAASHYDFDHSIHTSMTVTPVQLPTTISPTLQPARILLSHTFFSPPSSPNSEEEFNSHLPQESLSFNDALALLSSSSSSNDLLLSLSSPDQQESISSDGNY